MAIRKEAKNMQIRVHRDYNLQVGKTMQKVADKVNIESTKGKLHLGSVLHVVGRGGKVE